MARPCDLPAPWAELADQRGGVLILAAHMGVSYSTFRRWALGLSAPCKDHETELLDLFDKAHLPPPTFTR